MERKLVERICLAPEFVDTRFPQNGGSDGLATQRSKGLVYDCGRPDLEKVKPLQ